MAVHYTERAALLDLPAAKKLVLMCIADSANQDNRVGFPGLAAIQRWSGLGKSRALEVIAELVTGGYLVRHRAGVNGRRAEFVVFPHGCCALHEPLPGYSPERAGDADPGSGGPDPDDLGTNSQVPVEGPIEGPAQTGPLPSSVTPVLTSGGNSREQGSGDVAPPLIPPQRSCSRWPLEHGACRACATDREALAAWEAATHRDGLERAWVAAEAERVRLAEARALADAERAACSLCDAAGVLPSGLLCTHDPATIPKPGEGGRAEWDRAKADLAARNGRHAARTRRPSGLPPVGGQQAV